MPLGEKVSENPTSMLKMIFYHFQRGIMKKPKQDLPRDRHDKLIKLGLSEPKEIASLLQHHLPVKLVKQIDWTSLQSTNKKFIDEDFKSRESDLLYLAKTKKTKQDLWIYLLFEHQSEPDPWMGVAHAELSL